MPYSPSPLALLLALSSLLVSPALASDSSCLDDYTDFSCSDIYKEASECRCSFSGTCEGGE